jgi:hypothetical protein
MTVIAVANCAGTGGGYTHILGKPYYSSSWNAPYFSYQLTLDPTGVPLFDCSVSGTGYDSSGTAVNLNQSYVLSGTYDGSTVSFWENGGVPSTVSISGAIDNGDSTTKNLVIGQASVNSPREFFNGQIAEVLIYNRALTTAERQQVEGYLADKYELYDPSATWFLAYSSAEQEAIALYQWNKSQADIYAPFFTSFLATNPPVSPVGLVTWLRADVGVTSSGGNVSQWTDQSPFGNNAVQASGGNQPTLTSNAINGEPALTFNGSSSYLSIPDNPTLRPSTMTVIAVASSAGTSGYTHILGKPYYSSSSWNAPYLAYELSLNPTGVPLFSCSVAGTGGYDGTGTAVIPNQSYVLSGTYDGSTVSFCENGGPPSTTSISGAIDNGDSTTKNLVIGQASVNSPREFFNGQIAEVLIYNRALTTAERQQAEVYLADKYGIYDPNATWPLAYSGAVQAAITLYQWNKSQADFYAPFMATNPPVPQVGLVTWLRADAGVTSSGGNVSQWTDQSPFGNNAVQASGGNQPTLTSNAINGEPALTFNGSSSYLSIPDNPTLRPSAMTVIAVASSAGTGGGYTHILGKPYYSSSSWNAPYSSYELSINSTGVPFFNCSVAGTGGYDGAGTVVNLNQPYLLAGMYDGTNVSFWQNGGTPATTSISGTLDNGDSTTKNLVIGQASVNSPREYFNGQIAEVLIYNRVLSAAELQQAETYLAVKYNTNAPAPTITPNGGSYSSSVSVSFSSVPSPAVIRYTLDGTNPTASSTLYTGAFTLTQSAPVNCAIFLNNIQISPVASAQFYVGDSGNIGISDAWQMTYFGYVGIDPNALTPGGSGLTNLQAYLGGYNPNMYSTNGDGLSDAVNDELGYSGTDTDINGYGLTNAQQLALGLDPFDVGVNPSLPTPPTPDPTDHTAPVITLVNPQGATLLP